MRIYRLALSWALLARCVGVATGIGYLVLVARLLSQNEFGAFIIVFNLFGVAGTLCAAAFQRIILFKVSETRGACASADTVFGVCQVWALAIATVVALALSAIGGRAEQWFAIEGLAWWSVALGGWCILEAFRLLGVAWFRARQEIGRSVIVQDVLPNVTRFGAVAVVFVSDLDPAVGVAGSIYGGAVISVLVIIGWSQVAPKVQKGVLSRSDWGYGVRMLGTQVANQPAKRLDVVLLGALSSGGAVANYAVAARVAGLLMLGKDLIAQLLVPRLREAVAVGRIEAAGREYEGASVFASVVALAGATILMGTSDVLFGVFGESYQPAVPIAAVLAAGILVRAFAGLCGEYAGVRGMAGLSLFASCFALGVTVVGAVALVPALGSLGMAGAVAAGAVASNGIILWVLAHRCGVRLLDNYSVGCLVAGAVSTCAVGMGVISGAVGALVLALVTGVFIISKWELVMVAAGWFRREGGEAGQ